MKTQITQREARELEGMPELDRQEVLMLFFSVGLLLGYLGDVAAFSGAMMLITMFVLHLAEKS